MTRDGCSRIAYERQRTPMGKLLVLYLLVPFYLKFRYRNKPRIKRNIERWFLLFTSTILLLIAPWDLSDGAVGSLVRWLRVATALGLLGFLLFDIHRTMRSTDPG